MAGISGQPTPRPSDLPTAPKAVTPPLPDITFAASPVTAGTAPPPAQAAAPEPSIDDIMSQVDQLSTTGDMVEEGMSGLPEPTGWNSAKEQVREAATRLKNAFTVTGPESLAVLKQSGMFEDVRLSGDSVQVKRPGRKGWEKFDRDKLELLGDTLDFARDAFEGIVENAFRGAGTVAGTVALPGAGTAGGAAVGGASGAVLAKNAGDIAAEAIGISKDPNRNMALENTLAAGFGAGFGMLGSSLARRAAARQLATGEARKTLDFATKQATEAAEDIAEVQRSGIKLGADGKFKLDPQQIVGAGNVPELDATAKALSTEQSFRNFRRQIGDSLKGAYDSVAHSLGAVAGKGATLGDDFVLTAKDIRQVEGKLIGSFRAMADERLVGKPQVAPRTLQTLEIMEQAFTDSKTGKMSIDSIIANSPGLSDSQARVLMNEVGRVRSALKNGAVTLDAANGLMQNLNSSITKGMGTVSGKPYAVALLDLRNAIRDDHTDMMGTVLPEAYQQMYAASKSRYKQIMDSTSQLGKILDTENISRNELVGKLFESKGAYKFAKSTKTLLNETNPGMWDNLAGEYLTKLKQDATDGVNNSVNWGGMAKKWGNLDERLRDEILQSTGIPKEGMNALLKLGARVQGADFPALAKTPLMSVAKNTLKSAFNLFGGASAKGTAVTSLLEGMGKNQGLATWLKDGGMEEILKEMPGMKPAKSAALRDWIQNWTPAVTRKAVKQGTQTSARRRAEEAVAP